MCRKWKWLLIISIPTPLTPQSDPSATSSPPPPTIACKQGVYDCERIYNLPIGSDPRLPNNCSDYYDIYTNKVCEDEGFLQPGLCDVSDTTLPAGTPECVPR